MPFRPTLNSVLLSLSLVAHSFCHEQDVFDLGTNVDSENVVYVTQIETVTKTELLPYTAKPTKVADFRQAKNKFIKHHNYYRSLHGSRTLVWSDDLFKQCDAFIRDEFPVCDGNIHHSAQCNNGDVGEIITIGFDSVEDFMSSVYATNEAFDFANYTDLNPSTSKFFKQLVWNSTSEFACSMLDCGDYFSNLIVCQYDLGIDNATISDNVFPVV